MSIFAYCKRATTNHRNYNCMNSLSILIPVYNYMCVNTVKKLKAQCDSLGSTLKYEIIVADDGSTDGNSITSNEKINDFEYCKFICKPYNEGSAATRNFLAKESKYNWLLFLDSDVDIDNDRFIIKYLDALQENTVINGGIMAGGLYDKLKTNLRYLYEHHEESFHTAEKRNLTPYKCFRSANFIIPRNIFLTILFNNSMKRYEDVYFGKVLKQYNIKIININNPVVINDYENNEKYINKLELDLDILYNFRKELQGYSRLLSFYIQVQRIIPLFYLIKIWHRLMGRLERKILISKYTNLTVMKAYRIGYFISIKQ